MNKKGDIWIAGICLYQLAGSDLLYLKRLTLGKKFYNFKQKIDIDVNYAILNILTLN